MYRVFKFFRLIPCLLVFGVGGCSSQNLLPPSIPSGAELAEYHQKDFAAPYSIGATPEETLIIGIAYVDERCSQFFDSVEQMNRKLEVGQSTLNSASNQTLSLMSQAAKSALAIAEVAAVFEVTKVLLEQYREEFAFAPHSTELRAITFNAMEAQRKEFGLLLNDNPQGIGSHVAVIAAVKKYAENCTLAQIREHWNTAIAKAVDRGVKPTNAPSAGATRSISGVEFTGDARSYRTPRTILGVNKYVVR